VTYPTPTTYDILFSIGSSSGPADNCMDKNSSPHIYTMALMENGNMLFLDDCISVSNRDNSIPSKLTYQIGNSCSDNPSQSMTTWKNSSEISIVSYGSDAWKILESIRRMRDACEVPVYLTSAADAVGYLMSPEVFPEIFSLIEDKMPSLDIAEMVMVLRHSLLCYDTTLSFFRRILLVAVDAMERISAPLDLEQEVRYVLKCLQTATAYDWVQLHRPRPSAKTTSTSHAREPGQDCEDAEYPSSDVSCPDRSGLAISSSVSICGDSGQDSSAFLTSDRHVLDKIYSLMGDNCEQTYMECVASGCLDAASIILKMHLHDVLPAPCDTLLSSVASEHSITNIVDWARRDILPSLHRLCMMCDSAADESEGDEATSGARVAENVCNLLLDFAKKFEKSHKSAVDAIAASSLAVQIASSMLDNCSDDSECTAARAHSVHKVLDLEVTAWRMLGLTVGYDTVEQGGLRGILDVRLRSVEESAIVRDIQERIRPLISSYGGDVDDMLFNWISATLKSSVVKTDGDDSETEAETPENPDDEDAGFASVQVTRLVNVADGIGHPNLKARAVIILLQMLSTSACAESSSQDSSFLVFETLSRMRDEVSGYITASIADSLQEAFRTHRLRALASKYAIKALNLRDPKQIREAVSLIVTKTQISSSVTDALNFAESYSSAGVDICGMLVRALVTRILPLETDNVVNKDECVKAALRDIPRSKLRVVAEDTCSYLMSVVDGICLDAFQRGLKMGCLPDKKREGEFSDAISGVLQVSSYLLDAKSDDHSPLPSSDVQGGSKLRDITAAPSSFAAQKSMYDSSYVTTEFQTDVKRIKKLHSDFSVFIAFDSLWSRESCIDIVKQLAVKRCDEILVEVEANKSQPAPVSDLVFCHGIVTHSSSLSGIRKLCAVLDTSFVFALNSMQRYVLSKGSMVGSQLT
jgi:hypothetical protein